MENTDEVRGSSGSLTLGEECAARYAVDIIPESAGPRKLIARGSVIHSIRRGPGSQKFLAKEYSTGIVLAPARKLRASVGNDRIKEFDAPTGGLVINPAGVDSGLAWPATRENAVVSISTAALSDPAELEFDLFDVDLHRPAFDTVTSALTGEDDRCHRGMPRAGYAMAARTG